MHKVCFLLISISVFSQELTFHGVELPNYDEQAKLSSIIKCKYAFEKNGSVDMQDVQLKIFDKSNTEVLTQKCRYLRYEKKLKGDEKVFLKNKEMELTGKGFGYDTKSKILNIHSDVTIYLNSFEGEKK